MDIFARDLVVIPINCNQTHWTLALINVKWRRFEYYDSLFNSDCGRLRNLRRYVADEHKASTPTSADRPPAPLRPECAACAPTPRVH
mgnify:CR=1 FL=1